MLQRHIWSGRIAAGDMELVRNFFKKLHAKLGDDTGRAGDVPDHIR